MDLIPGFRWPVLKEFSPAVNFCQFKRGDVIYNDPEAYFIVWSEALQKLAISLLIQASERGKGIAGEEESIFKANWNSPVTVEITDHKSNSPKTTKQCKQGNMYTALWKGDLNYLQADLPVAPLRHNDLLKWLREEADAGTFAFHPLSTRIADLDCSHVFVLPGDNVSPITCHKLAELHKELSANCDFHTRVISLTEVPDPTLQLYAPTTLLYLFGVNTAKGGWSRGSFLQALKRALYKRNLNKKSAREQFRLSRHGVLIDQKPLTEKEIVTYPRHSFAAY